MVAATIVSAAYVAFQMMADIASLRIVMIAGFSIDAGTFVYPFTFTLRDLVHKTAGIKASRTLIVAAAVLNLLMAGLFWLTSILPPDIAVGPQEAFGQVLSPVWRIVFASIVAEVIAELVDTEGYRLWVEKVTHRYQWARVLVSNAFSIPVDSVLFSWLAFGGVLPNAVVWSIFISNVIIKGLTTLISLPGIYLVKESPKA
ncbi:MAG: queuosine precursor transporter [Anaerolineales bacterium]|nr:queuosine precursor transporter [Chloroflexota bacterium]MBL6981213.1 queuosine precursor transporter [Anaerolineales bacterium]